MSYKIIKAKTTDMVFVNIAIAKATAHNIETKINTMDDGFQWLIYDLSKLNPIKLAKFWKSFQNTSLLYAIDFDDNTESAIDSTDKFLDAVFENKCIGIELGMKPNIKDGLEKVTLTLYFDDKINQWFDEDENPISDNIINALPLQSKVNNAPG